MHTVDRSQAYRRAALWLRRHPEPAGRFVAVPAGPGDPLATVARTIERLAAETRPGREPDSRFVVVLDRDRDRPAGVLRVIAGHASGEPCWELATVAVLPEYRGKRSGLQVSALLYRALLLLGETHGVRHVVATVDRATARNLLAVGAPLTARGGVLHGDLTAFAGSYAEQAARLRRSARSGGLEVRGTDLRRFARRRIAADLAARLASGDGLDPQIVLPAPAT